jgi:hypothetical protein
VHKEKAAAGDEPGCRPHFEQSSNDRPAFRRLQRALALSHSAASRQYHFQKEDFPLSAV